MIKAVNVVKSFDDGRTVLKNISAEFGTGQTNLIIGRSGSGKTVLLKSLVGLHDVDEGAIYYDGRDLASLDLKSLRKNIGVVTQNGRLFQGDIYSNIVIAAPYLTVDDAWEAAAVAGIDEDIENMPMGMNTLISEGSGGISGGQRQRIMIARAVAPKPKLLILDEPTNGLDPTGIHQLRDILTKYAHEDGAAVMVSSHILSEMQLLCDRVGIINNGKLISVCSMEELNRQMNPTSRYSIKVSDAEQAAKLLTEKGDVKEIETADDVISADIEEDQIASIVRLLVTNDVDISEVRKIESSLEDIFLQVTGGGIDIE